MSINLKITATVLLILIISLSTFYFVFSEDPKDCSEENSSHLSDKDKTKKLIYFVGSSQVNRLNTTFIHEWVSNSNSDYEVYNVSLPSDVPVRRLSVLNYLICDQPDLVVYGIAYRDFSKNAIGNKKFLGTPDKDYNLNILPDPQRFFQNILAENFDSKINPKLFTLNFLKNLNKGNLESKESFLIQNDTRQIFVITKNDTFAEYGIEELKSNKEFVLKAEQFSKIDSYAYEKNLLALKKIIEILEDKDIKVILFTVPHSKLILDNISSSDYQLFNSTMQEFAEDGIKVYDLLDRYALLPLWTDSYHVTQSKSGLIYSEDITRIILEEIEK